MEMFLEDRRHRLMNPNAAPARSSAPGTQKPGRPNARRDSSPPHSATGRMTMTTPTSQLLIQ